MRSTTTYTSRNGIAQLIRILAIGFIGFGCEHKKVKEGGQGAAQTSGERTGTRSMTSETEIMGRYCRDVVQLKARTDFSAEIKYFCNNNAPTPAMLDLVKAITENPNGKAPLKMADVKHGADQWSEFWIVWGFKAPTVPIALKDRPIYDMIAKGTATPNLQLTATATRQPDETLDPAIHIWSAVLNYDLLILGSNNLRIPTKRTTQYNLYQVRPVVEDMGLAIEHMSEGENEDYKLATMINLSFANQAPGASGSINLALSHIRINNRGFPSTAETAMREISEFLADTMYKALQ